MTSEKIITGLCMVLGALVIVWLGIESSSFQQQCEEECGDARALTPIIDFQETCLCDMGHGKWRRVSNGTH